MPNVPKLILGAMLILSQPIHVNNRVINYIDIDYFNKSNRENNDKFNKKREDIIFAIITKKIPNEFYTESKKWNKIKKGIDKFISKLCKKHDIKYKDIQSIDCKYRGGRNYHYDFELTIKNNTFPIEFKFNNSPQFVSPGKPSRFLNREFEPWFYDNYLYKIAEYGNLQMPLKDEYCARVHSDKVECLKEFVSKYKNDKDFNKYCRKIAAEGIKKFIELTEIYSEKLSRYLLETQKNKIYMLYDGNTFNYETVDESLYKIKKLIKKEPTNYIYETERGMKLKITLRFKNGCGLQYPAFQITRKLPGKEILIKLCKENNIKLNSNEKVTKISAKLDNKKIIH